MPQATANSRRHASGIPRRAATNITLPEPLPREAKELNIVLSQACERGLAASVAEARAQRWREQNRAAIQTWNDYVEQHGLPLDEFRQF
ncbi:MAG TPA: type II toxin-antitoxin system CcdA family antitoxin [Acetobacteraceae bacterium]|jgi:antitoxin CcdA